MDVDGAGVDVDVAAPDAVQKLFARPDAARLFHEGRQQAELGRAELQRLAVAGHAVGLGIEHDVLVFEPQTGGGGPGAPELRPHPRHQLDDRVGFDHVVVGAGFKPAHAVDLFRAGRKHDDRHVAGFRPGLDLAADLDPGDVGQHPVEDHDVGVFLRHHQERLFAVAGAGNPEAFGLQVVGQDFALCRLVLDEQNRGLIRRHRPQSSSACENSGESR